MCSDGARETEVMRLMVFLGQSSIPSGRHSGHEEAVAVTGRNEIPLSKQHYQLLQIHSKITVTQL